MVLCVFGYIYSSLGSLNNICLMRDLMNNLDMLLMEHIVHDIVNGTLLTQEDDETVEMLLTHMYDDMTSYERLGVIVGKA